MDADMPKKPNIVFVLHRCARKRGAHFARLVLRWKQCPYGHRDGSVLRYDQGKGI